MRPSRLIAWLLPEDPLDRQQFVPLLLWISLVGGLLVAVALLESFRRGWLSGLGLIVALAATPLVLAFVARGVWALIAQGSGALIRTVLAGGGIPGPESTSFEEALVLKGKIPDAIASYEARINHSPRSTTLRFALAELYRQVADDANAVRVLQEIRLAAPGAHETAVTNALIDLYERMNARGPLMAEYARFAARHRGTAMGDAARNRLAQLKTEGSDPPRD